MRPVRSRPPMPTLLMLAALLAGGACVDEGEVGPDDDETGADDDDAGADDDDSAADDDDTPADDDDSGADDDDVADDDDSAPDDDDDDSAPDDEDGDGFDALTDCDDTDPAVHPGADEVCNGLDDDCDTQVDDLSACQFVWYWDDLGTFVSNTNMCHGFDCAGGASGRLVRLDTVPSGGTGEAVKQYGGLQPNTAYEVSLLGGTDGANGAPNNLLTVTVGTAVLVVDQTAGASVQTTATGSVTSDGSGFIELTATATDGAGGDGSVGSHGLVLHVLGWTHTPPAAPMP